MTTHDHNRENLALQQRIGELEAILTQRDDQVRELQQQLAAAKRDSERLDWIELHECAIGWPHPENFEYWIFTDGSGPDFNGSNLRAAIDAAMKHQQQKPQ